MDYEGICPECGGYLTSPYLYGSDYLVCETCGLVKDLCTGEYMHPDAE